MEWLSSGGVLVRCAIGWCGILCGVGWRGGVARAAGAGWRLALRGELGLHAQQHGRLHRETSHGRQLRAIVGNTFLQVTVSQTYFVPPGSAGCYLSPGYCVYRCEAYFMHFKKGLIV